MAKIKKPSNSVIFWNALYYTVLLILALIDIEFGQMLWFMASLVSMLMIAVSMLSPREADDLKWENQWWAYTTMPVLMIALVGGCAFIVIYPIYKLVRWINDLLDGKTCFRHDDKRTSELPKMVDDTNCASSYPITYTCQKCGREKHTSSDLMLGVRVILDEDEI